MVDMEDDDEMDMDEQEQIIQMITENGMLLHGLVGLLVQKGIISTEEITQEMNRLHDEFLQAAEADEGE